MQMFIVDRAIEFILVNDDNSILHKPTSLAIGGSRFSAPKSSGDRSDGTFLRVRLASR